MLKVALNNLDDRERRIITQRRLVDDPLTLDELSKSFGISRERVRQVEVRAFEKERKIVKNIDYKKNYQSLKGFYQDCIFPSWTCRQTWVSNSSSIN